MRGIFRLSTQLECMHPHGLASLPAQENSQYSAWSGFRLYTCLPLASAPTTFRPCSAYKPDIHTFASKLQDCFVLCALETLFTSSQNSWSALGCLQICLNDPSLNLPRQRIHPSHFLSCRSSLRRFIRSLPGHRISHLIAEYERHVVILMLDVHSRDVRSLPLHRECPLPRFQGSRHSPSKIGIATVPKSRCGPTPILPFLEDLVVCDEKPRCLACCQQPPRMPRAPPCPQCWFRPHRAYPSSHLWA